MHGAAKIYMPVAASVSVVAIVLLSNSTQGLPHHGAKTALLGHVGSMSSAANATDESSVKAAYEAAASAFQADQVAAHGPDGAAAPAAVDAMVAHGKAHFGQLLTAKGYAQQITRINGAAEVLKSGMRTFSGGADQFTYQSVNVTGTTATVQGTARFWLKLAKVRPDGTLDTADPANTLVVTSRLVRSAITSEDWKVDDFSWTFAPGSEP